MKVSKVVLMLAVASASGAAISAEAQKDAPTAAAFVDMAAQSGMAEVALAKLALDKSQDTRVKNFAERMVSDHGKANTELAALAKAKGIDVPRRLDATQQALVKAMEGKYGADFDSAYSQHMNMDHSKAVTLFESESKSSDADFASFARKTLPTLKEHKALAATLPSRKGS